MSNEVTDFQKKYDARIAKITKERRIAKDSATAKLDQAQKDLDTAIKKKDAAMAAIDPAALTAADDECRKAELMVLMYSKQCDMLDNSQEPSVVAETNGIFSDAKDLKNKLAEDTHKKIVDLLTQVEILGHTFQEDMLKIDEVVKEWHSNIRNVDGLSFYHSGHAVPFEDKSIYITINDVLNIAPYRAAHGHHETSFSSNSERWTLDTWCSK